MDAIDLAKFFDLEGLKTDRRLFLDEEERQYLAEKRRELIRDGRTLLPRSRDDLVKAFHKLGYIVTGYSEPWWTIAIPLELDELT